MDFQKKVTYLYDYEENGKSIGFAKWDVRNGMLRLLVNIRYQNRAAANNAAALSVFQCEEPRYQHFHCLTAGGMR